ncbi:MAG: tetratricopeptide repeat protein [Pedosphaera sp.]|nr:tetratricopeptide repeat protein [Pedosphaera sp.]
MEKIPLFAVSLVFAVVTFASQSAAGAVVGKSSPDEWRLLRIADSYGFYLGKIFWPGPLNVLYPITPLSFGRAAIAFALVLGITIIVLRWLRNRAWLAVGWLWFLGLLVPVIGLVPVGSTWVADRYTYLPSAGICVMFAWAMWTTASKPQSQFNFMLAALLIPIVLATVTIRNLPRWQSSIALFSDAVSKGDHPGAHQNLGAALAEEGDFETAITHYTRALELNPQSAEACYNRANAFRAREKLDRALADYTRAIELKPAYAEAFNNRGSLHAARGQFDPAIRDFTQAIALRADYTEALANRGHAYLEMGKYREAVDDYSKAVATKPDFTSAYHDRAVAYFNLKDFDRAWADIRACRKLGLSPSPELIRRLETDSGRRE